MEKQRQEMEGMSQRAKNMPGAGRQRVSWPGDRSLRRCLPLKIAVHLAMFIAFIVLMVTFVFGCLFAQMTLQRNETVVNETGNGYFQTELFLSDYCDALNRLSVVFATWAEYDAYGNPEEMAMWQDEYIRDYVNLQYAVYDTEGNLIASSPDFDASAAEAAGEGGTGSGGGQIFYYSNDFNGLELFKTQTRDTGNDHVTGSNFMPYFWYVFDAPQLKTHVGYIYTYVSGELVPGDAFYFHSRVCQSLETWKLPALCMAIGAVTVFVAGLIYTLLAAGWSRHEPELKLWWFDRIYTEPAVGLILLVEALFATAIAAFLGMTLAGRYMDDMLVAALLLPLAYIAGMFCIYSLARRGKAHNFISRSLIWKLCHGIYRVIYQGLINNHLMRKYISVVLGLGVVDFILLWLALSWGSVLFLLVVTVLFVCEFIYVGRKLMAIQDIAKGAREIASGHLDYKIDTKDMGSGVFLEFAGNINNIGQGLNRAVDESIKSERMKADLITNVSHDIKTPLTSIINYVDLLKRLDITDEPAREYIDILDSKSQRLKMLIEDLVEASRASSGNITLERSNIELNELVMQAAGTYVERYEQRHLTLVCTPAPQPLMIWADGRRMYRVLDNLLNNAFKYAMEGSRVYIDLYKENENACFVMKNISQAPLNISAEELTQSFVRGDASRTTEGSGLGLSIAQSLVELHGGSFKLHLDGDLFKAIIRLPLAED